MHTEQLFRWHIKYCWSGMLPIVSKWIVGGVHALLQGMTVITTNIAVFVCNAF